MQGGEPITVILSIDTEGDNLWADQAGRSFGNIAALGDFQVFCETQRLRPTYLVAYEVIEDEAARETIRQLRDRGNCEIGSHLHAWLTPPVYPVLDEGGGYPFLHEYPEELRVAKLERLTGDLEQIVGCKPTSYRGGRWSIEAFTMGQLDRLGYVADTTVTPFVSWVRTLGVAQGGPNCFAALCVPYHPAAEDPMRPGEMRILEIPTAHRPARPAADGLYRWAGRMFGNDRRTWSLAGRGMRLLAGKVLSPNPAVTPAEGLRRLVRRVATERPAVLNLSIHSSEVFPGGAPWVKDEADARQVRERFAAVTKLLDELGEWRGMTLSEYAAVHAT
jgi:hypothetical protein